jgi:hypothetical protein
MAVEKSRLEFRIWEYAVRSIVPRHAGASPPVRRTLRSAAVGEHREPMVRWSVGLGRLQREVGFVVKGDHSSS